MPKNSTPYEIGQFLIILGLGCICGGYLAGRFSDWLHMKNAGKLAIITSLIITLLTLAMLPYLNYTLAYICAFLWGYTR